MFYGWPMLEFIAREAFAAGARRDEIAAAALRRGAWPIALGVADAGHERDASPSYDTLKQIHAAWLLTPREDLDGSLPARDRARAA